MKLFYDTDELKRKFAIFMMDVQKDLEGRVDVVDVINALAFYDHNYREELSGCNRMHEVFFQMAKFVSFFDYDLVVSLIDARGSVNIKAKLAEYTKSFEKFAERRVVECPINIFGDCKASEKVLTLVSDKNIEDLTLDELKKFKHKIGKILGKETITIVRIDGGSIKITFRTFKINKFCLTKKQQKDLRKEGVTSISYGGQCIIIGKRLISFRPRHLPFIPG